MSGRRVRRLLVLLVVVAAAVRLLGRRAGGPPDVSRHPTVDGGVRAAPAPAADPYQAPVVEPAALVDDLAPLAPLDDVRRTVPAGSVDADATWSAPVDGACPDGYPVKAKLKSGIYHLPGMSAYERTTPDRCYPDAESAAADGLRAAKR